MKSVFTLVKKTVETEGLFSKIEVYYLDYSWSGTPYRHRVTKEEYSATELGQKITIDYSSSGHIRSVTPGDTSEEW